MSYTLRRLIELSLMDFDKAYDKSSGLSYNMLCEWRALILLGDNMFRISFKVVALGWKRMMMFIVSRFRKIYGRDILYLQSILT